MADRSWKTVTTITGVRAEARAESSLRVYRRDGSQAHIKGVVALERWSGTPTSYRVAYEGFEVVGDGTIVDIVGTVPPLPSRSTWTINSRKVQSDNAKARVMQLVFMDEDESSIKSIQLTAPFGDDNTNNKKAKLLFEAIMFADQELTGLGFRRSRRRR